MENQNIGDETYFEKFRWTINNFSKLNVRRFSSKTFFIGGYSWKILIYPMGKTDDKHLSIYLDTGNIPYLPKDWSRLTNFKLAVVNQVQSQLTKTYEAELQFNASKPSWGFPDFMTLSELHKSGGGFIVNDTCMVEAAIAVRKVYFKSFGKIEEIFVPLLEEVCSRHPSLIECQQNRSSMFTEWAFRALGRVLHFLKTTKVKDMIEDTCCRHLQLLWEELETCKFDLTWLQPHVIMENPTDKFVQLKTLKEKVAALGMEIDLLEEKISTLEEDLDLDVELGYG